MIRTPGRAVTMLLGLLLARCSSTTAAPQDTGVATDNPVVDAPSVDVPVVDAPVVDAPAVDAPAVDASTVDAPLADAPRVDASAGGPCPVEPPTASSPCAPSGLRCEYGTDPRPSCHVQAECMGGAWSVAFPRCPPPPAEMCPATRDAASGATCTAEGAYCSYSGLQCECTNCVRYPIARCDGPRTWHCDTPNTEPGCPTALPNLGVACNGDGVACSYGCEAERRRVCRGGSWQLDALGDMCPRSSRAAKRDIQYLGAAEADALAAQVRSIPLATYRYRDDTSARQHLGFILEDQPRGAWSVDDVNRRVDLYGYTSMLVAAVQSQQRQIEALQREVQSLRRRARPATSRGE